MKTRHTKLSKFR